MFNSEQGKRKMALVISHYAYRNTPLEDYHSKSIMMDMLFYKKIYKIVYTKLKKVELLHKYIENYNIEKIETKGDFENLLNTVPEELRFKFMRYFSNIITIIHYNFGSDWDSAELLDYNINNKGATNFFYQDASLNVVKREQF